MAGCPVRDYSNLAWPEGPFGAAQRPFGRPTEMVAAFAIDWARRPGLLPLAAATVYLRVRKHGQPLSVSSGTLSIGFRAAVIEHPAEVPDLLPLVARALTRARRHALILAGHDLATDLTRMTGLSPAPLRGVAGVASAWADRRVRQRGMALMVDTSAEARDTSRGLNLPVDPASAPESTESCAGLARAVLTRCLAIGLTAAVHTGRYRLEGTFPVHGTVERAGWDLFASHAPPEPATPTGEPALPVASVTANPTTR
jgi:hypothetical protein